MGVGLLVVACGSAITASSPNARASPSSQPSPGSSSTSAATEPVSSGQILFTRTSKGDRQAIFAAAADGTGEHQLTAPGDYGGIVRISPDGTRILTMPGHDPLPTPVTGGTLAVDGSGFVRLPLTDPTLNLVPQAWSPDGQRIAFEGFDDSKPGRTGVYTARVADGGDLVRVTTAKGAPHDIPLDYSPDGARLVFYRAVKAEPDFPIDIGGSLWVANVDGSDAHQISTPATPSFDWARWSPDGTKILFGAERLQPTGGLWTVGSDGSALTKIFEDADGRYPVQPTWSPDGSQIMFALDPVADKFTHPDNGLYVTNADGTALRLVIGSSDFKSLPEWWR
jgi:Tol biopolymer transport system component